MFSWLLNTNKENDSHGLRYFAAVTCVVTLGKAFREDQIMAAKETRMLK